MRIYLFAILICLLYFTPAQAVEKEYPKAPSTLPFVTDQMQTAGYWISRHPQPDQLIMEQAEIEAYNARIREKGLVKDIFAARSAESFENLSGDLTKRIDAYAQERFYDIKGAIVERAQIDLYRSNMNIPGIMLGVAARYGLLIHQSAVRFLPTDDGLFKMAGDLDFDELQNSSLDVGTPVVVVHVSKDKKWFYVVSALSDGWVSANDIVLGDEKVIEAYASMKQAAVIRVPKADLFADADMMDTVDFLHMGSRLPFKSETDKYVQVLYPTKDKENKLLIKDGYIARAQANNGYLPMSARTVLTLSFSMLHQPYGWGGMHGDVDCSAFIAHVYAAMGVTLPRDSINQAMAGLELHTYDSKAEGLTKIADLTRSPSANSLLYMKGHILIFLGVVDGKAYAIHAVWAFRKSVNGEDVPYVIGRVAVTDLSLGEGSSKGSLLKRLLKVIEIK